MYVVHARNVNDAYYTGVNYLLRNGVRSESRAGRVLVAPTPVTTVYARPTERVLMDPLRDANPFFHLFESLWMLAGRDDAAFLNQFVGDFGARFGEADGKIHGAYGHRWRTALGYDQLDVVVEKLRSNPDDRQAVIQIWDGTPTHGVIQDYLGVGSSSNIVHAGSDDLTGSWKDRPCNTQIYLRVRRELEPTGRLLLTDPPREKTEERLYLDLTVCCRSNDVVWGAYGANAVHFSVLQEYLAARIDVAVGIMYQISNNFHGYEEVLGKIGDPVKRVDPYVQAFSAAFSCAPQPMVATPEEWDRNLRHFMDWTESEDPMNDPQGYPLNPWFEHTAEPLFVAHKLWKAGEREHAYEVVETRDDTMASDWRLATMTWMKRRMERRQKIEETRAS